MSKQWQEQSGEIVEMFTKNEVNHLWCDIAKSGPFAGSPVWPAFWRLGDGSRNSPMMMQPAIQQTAPKGQLYYGVKTRMVQVLQPVTLTAEEWDARPKGKHGAENAETIAWAFQKLGVAGWFK